MTYKIHSISYDTRVKAFWTIVGFSILSLFAYIYAIHTIAINTASRQALESRITETVSEIATLEFAYIEARNAVSAEIAASHGFSEAKSPLYVSRGSLSALTYNR